jgi:ribose-phosphate pyrophosphokinase
MKIFSGTSCQNLTSEICKVLNEELIKSSSFGMTDGEIVPGRLKVDKFSDGEMLPLFQESVRDQDVFFIQTTNNSDNIIETLLVIDAAKRAGCKSFTLVAPFQGYSRQDKTDHPSSIQGFYNVPVIHLNGNKIFIEHIKNTGLDNICVVAPDQGAVKRAADFCKAFPDATFAMINKKRIKPNEIHSMELVGDVSGKNVIIVDDMADTLGTMKKAADLLIEKGALSVTGVATHGILSGNAMDNLQSSKMSQFLVSDTIASSLDKEQSQMNLNKKLKVVSCASLIAKSIWSLSQHKSIHEINIV